MACSVPAGVDVGLIISGMAVMMLLAAWWADPGRPAPSIGAS